MLNGGAIPRRPLLEQRSGAVSIEILLAYVGGIVRNGLLSNQVGSARSLVITEINMLLFITLATIHTHC